MAWGLGNFREQTQDDSWRDPLRVATENPPPLPVIRPMATPVMDLKRETANQWDFSPEARRQLYDANVTVNYLPTETMMERGDPAGLFSPIGHEGRDESHLMIYEPEGGQPHTVYGANGQEGQWPSLGAGVLAHEFGHKWQAEQMPEDLRREWYGGGWLDSNQWSPGTGAQFRADHNAGRMDEASWNSLAGETYANSVMNTQGRDTEIPAWFRDKYFAGLFNDSAQEWQAPYLGPPPPTSDILRERVPAERWPSLNGALG